MTGITILNIILVLVATLVMVIVIIKERKTSKALSALMKKQDEKEKMYYGDSWSVENQARIVHELEKRRRIFAYHIENPDRKISELVIEYESNKAESMEVEFINNSTLDGLEYLDSVSNWAVNKKNHHLLHDILGFCLNLLDNAIEGAANSKDEKKVFFYVDKCEKGMIFTVENTISNDKEFKPNFSDMKSTKDNIIIHGHGSGIINDIIKNYGGTIVENSLNKNTVKFSIIIDFYA